MDQCACGHAARCALSILAPVLVAALAACGGAQDDAPDQAQTGQGDVARSVAALQQYQRERPLLAARAGLPNGVVNAGLSAPPRTCAQRLHAALTSATSAVPEPFSCLVGLHRGVDLKGRDCALSIDATPQAYRFRQHAGALLVESETRTGPRAITIDHRLTPADVELGEIGLQMRREDRSPGGARETLTLAIAPQPDGRDLLQTMSFERVQAGTVKITRCRFAR
jgi:hypothetical protein